MSVPIGTRLGRYQILAVLGRGGMGEVYRAHDTSLKRHVAVKILSDRLATDADGLRRFEQESLATAALNHPNILAVYDVGTHGGTAFVVSELLEGRTLRDVLAASTLSPRKTIEYAAQIANGLAAAHDKGIVHRDLKPANLWVTGDGRVKILDFGLARILPNAPKDKSAEWSAAQTMTSPGMVLGTAGYMAPEQVRGEPVDHRADIFSFGVVLYEMLTGRRAFERGTVQGTLAAILDADPPSWTGDGSTTSLRLLRLAHRCLEKAPQARLQSARDLSHFLADEGSDAAFGIAASRSHPGLFGLVTTVLLLAMAGGWAWLRLSTPRTKADSAPSVTFEVPPPAGDRWAPNLRPAISADGRRIVYEVIHDGVPQLFVREITEVAARPLPGTAGAIQPFFAPDGLRVAFFADGQLKTTSVRQSVPSVICPVSSPRGGAWGDDELIVFASGAATGLSRVAATGGTPEPLTFLDGTKGELSHRFPHMLPRASGVLFTVLNSKNAASVAVQAAGSKEHTTVIEHGNAPQYAQHYLVYSNEHKEPTAVPFDPSSMRVVGAAATQPERPTTGFGNGDSGFSLARNGTLAFHPFELDVRSLVITSRTGEAQTIPTPPRDFGCPRVSPDGRRIAVAIKSGVDSWQVWAGDEGGHFTLVTADGVGANPVWMPDSRSIAFGSPRLGILNVFAQPADGSGTARQLTFAPTEARPLSWSPDGQTLLIAQTSPQGIIDIRAVSPGGHDPPRLLFPTKVSVQGSGSPDGRWIAYTSAVSGQREVYLTSLPTPGRTLTVSQGAGGWSPVWAKSGRELFFRRLDGQVVAVKVGFDGPSSENPRSAGVGDVAVTPENFGPAYDTFPDGRFLVVRGASGRQDTRPLVVVLNWIEGLAYR